MREEALAKSYRPLNALFSKANSFCLVGGGRIGEIFVQCTPAALDRLDQRIEARAELKPRLVRNRIGELRLRPSAFRSELGGIEDIRLPASADRISFSAREAADWLGRPDTFGAYFVELFRPDTKVDPFAVNAMVEGFRQRLVRLGGIVALPLFPTGSGRASRGHLAMSVQLTRDRDRSLISLPLDEPRAVHKPLPLVHDVPAERHQHFLDLMAAEPLVRRVTLPPSLETTPLGRSQAVRIAELPVPPEHGAPVVGIIDGGVADISALSPWRTGGTDPVNPDDRDHAHGTFIAGLVAGAQTLNSHIRATLEPAGCSYFDIPLMPRRELVSSYYAGPSDFFDQLEEEVVRAKADAGVRIFNLSLGATGMRRGLGYSVFAQCLDHIAAEHDVLFVVSAGNLRSTDARAPWPDDGDEAVRLLASRMVSDEFLTAPAEHLLGLSVGALNPPGIPGHGAGLPTTYTRRGPGVGGARKPDLSHYGGASSHGGSSTGLYSFAPDGAIVDSNGTSFAAPLVASTVATINHRLDGVVPRETLVALLVHRARRCEAMQHIALRHVAREFVGFGMAPPADACLSDRPGSITLVFSQTLAHRQELSFVFSWPRSLVTAEGKCRGQVDVTLAFTPPVDARFDAESLRVQLEASLCQIETDPDTGEENPQSRLNRYDSALPPHRPDIHRDLSLEERSQMDTCEALQPVNATGAW